MPEYRNVSRPTTLKASPLTAEEVAALPVHADGAVGLNAHAGWPRQLDIWWKDGATIVKPIDGPADLQPWKFSGAIDPFHVREHFEAKVAPTLTQED